MSQDLGSPILEILQCLFAQRLRVSCESPVSCASCLTHVGSSLGVVRMEEVGHNLHGGYFLSFKTYVVLYCPCTCILYTVYLYIIHPLSTVPGLPTFQHGCSALGQRPGAISILQIP